MNKIFKKQSAGFYLACVSVLFGIIAFIFYLSCSIGGYYNDVSAGIISMLITAIILSIVMVVLASIFPKNRYIKYINLGVIALEMFALLNLL